MTWLAASLIPVLDCQVKENGSRLGAEMVTFPVVLITQPLMHDRPHPRCLPIVTRCSPRFPPGTHRCHRGPLEHAPARERSGWKIPRVADGPDISVWAIFKAHHSVPLAIAAARMGSWLANATTAGSSGATAPSATCSARYQLSSLSIAL